MFCGSVFKDPVIIMAQIFSVISFVLTLWFTFLGTDICAAIAMLLLLIAACRDIKVVGIASASVRRGF